MLDAILRTISRLPLGVLYVISDVVYVLLYYIIRYRRHIVSRNLATSFPEKSADERKKIERNFYRWLCDYFVETLKLLTISHEEMRSRVEWNGMEHIFEAWDRGQNVSIFLGHYCNWEWLSGIGLFYTEKYKDSVSGMIYHSLRNDTADDMMLKIRSALGGMCINKRKILRTLVTLRKEKRNYLMGYIFDQGPKYENIHLWMDFLNHDTAVFTGAERLSRKFNEKVVFLKMERPRRGAYRVTIVPVTDTPNDLPEFEITKRCMGMLEQSIREVPHLYLWTHNRWKRTHEDYNEWLKLHSGK